MIDIRQMPGSAGNITLKISVRVIRPSDEVSRSFWNFRLAFPQIHWMSQVRVWDVNEQWLWPNLPFLLKLPGVERVDRYGGVDPGKGVDNDYAAVLIRKFAAGETGGVVDTTSIPLVSAQWHPVGVAGKTDRRTLVHEAQSDEFILHIKRAELTEPRRLAVWLIYADFLGARLPAGWPGKPEYAGGALAFFHVDLKHRADGGVELTTRQVVPPPPTGFDWTTWDGKARVED